MTVICVFQLESLSDDYLSFFFRFTKWH